MARTDVADKRARWIAVLARRFGCSMADVRAMTIRDVGALNDVIREENAERRRQQGRAQRASRRR